MIRNFETNLLYRTAKSIAVVGSVTLSYISTSRLSTYGAAAAITLLAVDIMTWTTIMLAGTRSLNGYVVVKLVNTIAASSITAFALLVIWGMPVVSSTLLPMAAALAGPAIAELLLDLAMVSISGSASAPGGSKQLDRPGRRAYSNPPRSPSDSRGREYSSFNVESDDSSESDNDGADLRDGFCVDASFADMGLGEGDLERSLVYDSPSHCHGVSGSFPGDDGFTASPILGGAGSFIDYGSI